MSTLLTSEAEIELNLLDLNIEADGTCRWDSLLIEFPPGGPVVDSLCGNQIEQSLFVGVTPVTLTFTADGGVQFPGFRIGKVKTKKKFFWSF